MEMSRTYSSQAFTRHGFIVNDRGISAFIRSWRLMSWNWLADGFRTSEFMPVGKQRSNLRFTFFHPIPRFFGTIGSIERPRSCSSEPCLLQANFTSFGLSVKLDTCLKSVFSINGISSIGGNEKFLGHPTAAVNSIMSFVLFLRGFEVQRSSLNRASSFQWQCLSCYISF